MTSSSPAGVGVILVGGGRDVVDIQTSPSISFVADCSPAGVGVILSCDLGIASKGVFSLGLEMIPNGMSS